jgi:hypothetical protein
VFTIQFMKLFRKQIRVWIESEELWKQSPNGVEFTEKSAFITDIVHRRDFIDPLTSRDGRCFCGGEDAIDPNQGGIVVWTDRNQTGGTEGIL